MQPKKGDGTPLTAADIRKCLKAAGKEVNRIERERKIQEQNERMRRIKNGLPDPMKVRHGCRPRHYRCPGEKEGD